MKNPNSAAVVRLRMFRSFGTILPVSELERCLFRDAMCAAHANLQDIHTAAPTYDLTISGSTVVP